MRRVELLARANLDVRWRDAWPHANCLLPLPIGAANPTVQPPPVSTARAAQTQSYSPDAARGIALLPQIPASVPARTRGWFPAIENATHLGASASGSAICRADSI